MNDKKIVVLLDSVCRTIAGVCVEENDKEIIIENPVILNAVPNQEGQMTIQLIPVFFREILLDVNHNSTFAYSKDNITMSNISELNTQLKVQYASLFNKIATTVPSTEQEPNKVVDLFGDSDDK